MIGGGVLGEMYEWDTWQIAVVSIGLTAFLIALVILNPEGMNILELLK